MAKLWHTKRIPSSITATDAAAGYPAANLGSESIAQPWVAASTGAKTIDLILPAAAGVNALFLQDANFAAATAKWSADGVSFSAGAAMTLYPNDMGRYRGIFVYAEASVKTVRIEIANGAPVDGLPPRIGAAYLMATQESVLGPEWGYSAAWTMPQSETALANGRVATAAIGMPFDIITLTWKPRTGEALESLLQKARAGTVIWTPDLPSAPDEIWPVRFQENRLQRARESSAQSSKSAVLREVV